MVLVIIQLQMQGESGTRHIEAKIIGAITNRIQTYCDKSLCRYYNNFHGAIKRIGKNRRKILFFKIIY